MDVKTLATLLHEHPGDSSVSCGNGFISIQTPHTKRTLIRVPRFIDTYPLITLMKSKHIKYIPDMDKFCDKYHTILETMNATGNWNDVWESICIWLSGMPTGSDPRVRYEKMKPYLTKQGIKTYLRDI
jgi:hypothetical protein